MKFTFQPESKPLAGYTIKRAIHRGGFGEVYYALTDAGKEVALKLLKQHLDVELRGVAQCLNLKHPNLVTIFDVKQDDDGDHWVIMEYVNGKSLAQVLDVYPDGMPMDEVRLWLAGMVEGLSFLHDRGIVHRDLKPGNVFLENRIVKIGDVGLSKFISESHRSAQTQSVGTVYYMAPEVAHGRYGREVDVYSLGIVLYELLTGRVPFIGESAGEILMKHLSERPDLSPIPRRLRPVLAQSLEKDPLRRTPTVRHLLEDFNKAVVGFDVPQEIPEESFVHPTMADSSTLERERAERGHESFPETISDGPSQRPGQDRPAFDRGPWWQNGGGEPRLKDIIAGDVAKAVALAEKAARKAKEMADEACRASSRHQKHSRRLQRKMERWNRYAGRVREKYPTFWGCGTSQKAATNERRQAVQAPGGLAGTPQTAADNDQCGRDWFGSLCAKPALIALIVLAFIPKPFAHATVELVTNYALCGLVIYGIYRYSSRLVRGRAPANAGNRPNSPAGFAPGAAAVAPERRYEPPRPVVASVGVRRWPILTPDTPRWIPPRQRMSELATSLTYATLCAVLVTGGLALSTSLFADNSQIAQFGGTILVASWLLLAQSKLWEGSPVDGGMRGVSLIASGAAVGLVSWWLNHLLVVDIPTADSFSPLFERIGPHDLVVSGTKGQPALAGYITFFVCLFVLRKWWRQADSFRTKRLAIWSIVPTAAVGMALTALFAFPTVWGTVWAAATSATVQLAAAWVPQRDRAALMEAVNHA